MLVGYMRVSKADGSQTTDLQHDALIAAGVDPERVYEDRASGKKDDRPELTACLKGLRDRDTLVVWKLDRLGRSLSHLIATLDDLGRRGVGFRSLTESMDTTTAAGRLTYALMGAFAAFERDLIIERTNAGISRARDAGKHLGRPTKVTARQHHLIRTMAANGETQRAIAETTGLSRSVVGRVIRNEIPSLRHGEVYEA